MQPPPPPTPTPGPRSRPGPRIPGTSGYSLAPCYTRITKDDRPSTAGPKDRCEILTPHCTTFSPVSCSRTPPFPRHTPNWTDNSRTPRVTYTDRLNSFAYSITHPPKPLPHPPSPPCNTSKNWPRLLQFSNPCSIRTVVPPILHTQIYLERENIILTFLWITHEVKEFLFSYLTLISFYFHRFYNHIYRTNRRMIYFFIGVKKLFLQFYFFKF